jgi:perosamine synthetase
MNITLTKPAIDEADIKTMEKAVRRKAVSQGEITSRFEKDFADYLGATGAVATNSGTSALILALKTVGVKEGDEVILPSYTCLAVLHAVTQVGAVPCLVDNTYCVETMDYNIAIEKIQEKISPQTAAIIVPHMFGVPAEIDSIVKMGPPVIEDITLSVGASCRGKLVGAWGAVSVCSFHASKMMSCGEGGALVAMSESFYERARYLNGWEDEQAELRTSSGDLPAYELRYNFHLSGIAAALGISQLQKLPSFVATRRRLALRYTERLSKLPNVRCPVPNEQNVFFRYLVAVEDEDPATIIRGLADFGIEAGRGVFPPLHSYLKEANGNFPGAEQAVKTLVSIPLYPALTEAEVEHTLSATERVLAKS